MDAVVASSSANNHFLLECIMMAEVTDVCSKPQQQMTKPENVKARLSLRGRQQVELRVRNQPGLLQHALSGQADTGN